MEYVTPEVNEVTEITGETLKITTVDPPALGVTFTLYLVGLQAFGSGGTTVRFPEVLEVGTKLMTVG